MSRTVKHHPASEGFGDDLIELGVVGRPFGLKGGVRLRLYNLDSETISRVEEIIIAAEGEEPQRYKVRSVRPHQGVFAVELEECGTREEAERLRGSRVYVEKSSLPELESDEYYWFQLIGLKVYCGDEYLGRVERIISASQALDGTDVLVVESETGGEKMIPAAKDIVQEVDIESGKIMIEPGKGYETQV